MAEVTLNFDGFNALYLGTSGDTGVTRISLNGIALSTIRSIRIEDDGNIAGGSGAASGYDLDFAKLSTSQTTSPSVAATRFDQSIDYHSAVFNPGYMKPFQLRDSPSWNLSRHLGQGSDGSISFGAVDFGAKNGLYGADVGALSLGEGGAIGFNLFQPITQISNLFLYLGDVGEGNDGFRVVLSDQVAGNVASGLHLSGDSANNSIRLGEGVNSQIGAGNDVLFGLEGNDDLFSASGNDMLTGGAGNDSVDGGSGTDGAGFSGNRANYTLNKSGSSYVVQATTGTDGTDTLTNIERLQFSDKKIAIDLTPEGHAGQAMEFIGAVAPDLLNDTSIRGTIISLFDQGQTMESLSQLALDLNLLPTTSNIALANAVYHNVVGGTASTEMTNALVSYIESHGQANFLATVAGMSINVDLVGLQQAGVDYLI